ncbi:hypothetical protein [Ruminococcus sp.]|uniref:hypothetical protein n=1 Tax=Ruminococcus sp. TaxID=41978 RepID=UPI0025E68262|nr:hypothetical protein [Ruminococcus sp.]
MKTILRVLNSMNKKALVGLVLAAAIAVGCFQIAARAETVTAGYNGQAEWNTGYCGGGVGLGYGYVVDNIGKKYGEDAKAAYQNAVITGDYTAYRTLVGDWNPTSRVEGINVHPDGRSFVGNPLTTAQAYESEAYTLFGKYGTVNDLFAYAAGLGYDLNNPEQHNKFTIGTALGTIAKPAKKAAPAKTTAAKTVPASDKKVEALKTYKGNNSEFNAYNYYSRYPDLQSVFGPNGDALKKHYNEFGKGEGRNAK